MAQIANVEAQAEIKSSTEKFYGFFKNQMRSLVQMFPQNLKSCEILGGGDALTSGTIMTWKYDLGNFNKFFFFFLAYVYIFGSLI